MSIFSFSKKTPKLILGSRKTLIVVQFSEQNCNLNQTKAKHTIEIFFIIFFKKKEEESGTSKETVKPNRSAEEDEAATRIQAGFHGYKVRKDLAAKKQVSITHIPKAVFLYTVKSESLV